jgi:hypothetical protein
VAGAINCARVPWTVGTSGVGIQLPGAIQVLSSPKQTVQELNALTKSIGDRGAHVVPRVAAEHELDMVL